MDNQKIIDEARCLVDGDIEIPAWAVAVALQLGYTGSIVFHVASVVLKWHDLHGNDQESAGTASRGGRTGEAMTYLEQHCQDGRHVECVRDAICGCACHKRGTREWHERCVQYAYRAREAAASAATKKYWTKNIREHEKAIDDMLAVERRAVDRKDLR